MLPLNMVFIKPRWLETLPLLYQILLYQAFSCVDFLAPRELDDLRQHMQHWALKKAFSYNPYPVSVFRGILLPLLFTGSSLFLLMWCFLITEIVETPWLSKSFVLPGLLLCRLPAPSELGDVHKLMWDWALNKVSSYNPDHLLVIQSKNEFFNPRGWWNPPLTFWKFWLFQVFSRVDCLTSSELADLHKH